MEKPILKCEHFWIPFHYESPRVIKSTNPEMPDVTIAGYLLLVCAKCTRTKMIDPNKQQIKNEKV